MRILLFLATLGLISAKKTFPKQDCKTQKWNKYMQKFNPNACFWNPLHLEMAQAINVKHKKCNLIWKKRVRKSTCGNVDGSYKNITSVARWKKCIRGRTNCRQQAYDDRDHQRWLKIVACKCLDKQVHESNGKESGKMRAHRFGYCKTWRDFAGLSGKGMGRWRKTNFKLLDGIKQFILKRNEEESYSTCRRFAEISDVYGIEFLGDQSFDVEGSGDESLEQSDQQLVDNVTSFE